MSGSGENATRLVTPQVAIGLVVVSLLSLIAFLALSAYAPDFRPESDTGAHVLSKSAVGFAGLRLLLEEAGVASTIDRGDAPPERWRAGLTILTPTADNTGSEVAALTSAGATLIVLPKWQVMADPAAFGRVLKNGEIPANLVAKLLRALSATTTIARHGGIPAADIKAATGTAFAVPGKIAAIDQLQTVSGKDWVPVLSNADGRAVLAMLRSKAVFVLADPDLMNTHGLHDRATAALAVAIITWLRPHRETLVFDVTLNGFRHAPSLLHNAFAPPFLGATLCALLAAILIGLHAASRFGTPRPPPPVFALGKQALANNTAGLIRMMQREPQMAPRYALATRSLVLRALGVRRQMEARQNEALLLALERGGTSFAELQTQAAQVKSRGQLVALAQRLFQWRERLIHARS
jgi:hypothetical protein